MPPPRVEELEESSESSAGSESEEPPAPAAPVVTAEAASARAAALAEQLAARVPPAAAPAPSAPPGAELEPLILEAEAQDLVVIGNASNCSSWIGQAIADSQFVAVVKTPVAPSTSVIVDARLAEEVGHIKAEVLQRRWMALRVRRPTGDPRLPLRELGALCDQLVTAGVEPRTLVPIDSRSYLLMSKEHVHVSVTALVQCGHLVSPAKRVVNAIPIPETFREVPESQVGAWKLQQRHSAGTTKDCLKGDLFQCILRIQAKCGMYCEVRSTSAEELQLSSFGMLRMDETRSWRDSAVDVQVSNGSPTPLLRFTEGSEGEGNPTLKEETLSSQGTAQGLMETWSKLPGSGTTCLELEAAAGLAGLWIFSGNLFLRIIGVPKSQSLLGSHCCRSLSHLEYFHTADAVRGELRKFEALVGEVEQPGVLRVHRSTEGSVPRLILDARPMDSSSGTAGSVELQMENGLVLQQEPEGRQLRWRIKEWSFDPFTVPEPSVESEPEAQAPEAQASESESVSESVRQKQKKDAKAATKGAAPKAKAKAKAAAEKPSPKEERETDDEKEEKEVKKKKHKKHKEKEKGRRSSSESPRSSSEVKKKKKKDKSRGRSERKDKKEKDKEKRKKKKRGKSKASSHSSRRRRKRGKSRRKATAGSSSERGKRRAAPDSERSASKPKEEKPARAASPVEELSDREMRLRRFAEQSKLIPQAMEALRNLKADLQDKIMEEGPIKEGDGNPIIVLMNRIKEVAEWAQQEADREEKAKADAAQAPETTPEVTKANGTAAAEPDAAPDPMLLRAFSLQNQLPDSAMETLKALPGEVLMNVLMLGPLEASDNPTAALQKRIEEAR